MRFKTSKDRVETGRAHIVQWNKQLRNKFARPTLGSETKNTNNPPKGAIERNAAVENATGFSSSRVPIEPLITDP